MDDTPTQIEKSAAPAARPRKAPARRKPASSKTRKSPVRRKKAPARKGRAAASANSFANLLDDLASRAAGAGKEIRVLSGKGAGAARKAWNEVGATSRRTIQRLTKEWEGMDSTRRAQFVAALLAALAAASAPIVRGRMKK
jgi:inosine/xanthosine triphosphate pyrophosphatase family protein